MRLFHFSSEPDISEFLPRPPLRHPESEALVYAIDERHMPLYLFPRECPRIGIWDSQDPNFTMALYIDHSWKAAKDEGHIYRYEFETKGFTSCEDHGCWVCHQLVKPLNVQCLTGLPSLIGQSGSTLEASNLVELGKSLFDRKSQEWTTTLHVSMIRLSNLLNWDGPPGQPVLVPVQEPGKS